MADSERSARAARPARQQRLLLRPNLSAVGPIPAPVRSVRLQKVRGFSVEALCPGLKGSDSVVQTRVPIFTDLSPRSTYVRLAG
jgi:hypothetical protein